MSRRARLRRRLVVAGLMICVGVVVPVALMGLAFVRTFQDMALRGGSTPAVVAADGDLGIGVLTLAAVGIAGLIFGLVTLLQLVRLPPEERDEFIT